MVRTGVFSYMGGLVVVVVLLFAANLLHRLGISVSEALYLSALGLTVVGYGITEWRLRREK